VTAIRIVFLGDSITHGVGDARGIGWPGRLSERARQNGDDPTCYNLGIRGDTSALIAARWRAECAARLPREAWRAILFSFGLNDATRVDGTLRVPLPRSEEIARTMIAEARTLAPVLWIGPTPVDDSTQPLLSSLGILQTKRNAETARYDACFRHIAGQLGVPYLSLFDALARVPKWPGLLCDGVHPTAEGYDIMAAAIDEWPAWRALFEAPELNVKPVTTGGTSK
jgi:lysophospholipase L1-like esterase